MKDIILRAQYGSKPIEIRLTNPNGAAGIYHIMIEDFYHGQVCLMADGWHVNLNRNSWLSEEDCEVILEAVKPVG